MIEVRIDKYERPIGGIHSGFTGEYHQWKFNGAYGPWISGPPESAAQDFLAFCEKIGAPTHGYERFAPLGIMNAKVPRFRFTLDGKEVTP